MILLRLCLESPLLNTVRFKTINDADYHSSLYLKMFVLVEISCVFESKDFSDRKYLLLMWLPVISSPTTQAMQATESALVYFLELL